MVRNFVTFGVSRAIAFAAQIVMVPLVVMQVGPAGYGTFNLALQSALLAKLIATQATNQVLVRDHETLDVLGNGDYLRSALVISALVLILLGALALASAGLLGELFGLSPSVIAIVLVLAGALSILSIQLIQLYLSDFRRYSVYDAAQIVLSSLFLVVASSVHPTVEALLLGYLLAVALIALQVRIPQPSRGMPTEALRELWARARVYGLPLMISEIFGWALAVIDRFQIAAILSLEETGRYAAAYQLFVAPGSMIGFAVALAVQPRAFSSDTEAFRSQLEKASAFLGLLCAVYAAIALLFGQYAFSIYFPSGERLSHAAIALLVFAGIANSYLYLDLVATKRGRQPNLLLIAQSAALVAVLVSNSILLKPLGILAAALTSLFAYLLQITIIRIYMVDEVRYRRFSVAAAMRLLAHGVDRLVKKDHEAR